MFIYKGQEAIDKMTPLEADAYQTEKRAFEQEGTNKQIADAMAVATLAFETKFKDANDQIAKLKENSIETAKSKVVGLKEELESNKSVLKDIASGISNKEVVVKALSNRASIANNEQAYDLPDIGQLATRKLSMYDIFPKLTIGDGNNNGVIRYYDWDEATIARAAAAVAEGVAFPESTAKFKKGSVTIQKVGDTLPVTEEFFEDAQMFAAELGMFLDTNVALECDRQLALGDGTGNTITGLVASVDAYVPAAAGIADASTYDLLVKVSESITAGGGSKYMPNFAVMNIADINKMKLKKDANFNYVLPPFVSREGAVVSGITIIEANIIPANTLVLGDNRFARIYEKGGVEMSKGYSGTQFVEDEMTLKARKRMAFLIRAADKGGFKKVTSISAALTTLASVI
jgi:hypothetical protein